MEYVYFTITLAEKYFYIEINLVCLVGKISNKLELTYFFNTQVWSNKTIFENK